jgi:hypothetical protein
MPSYKTSRTVVKSAPELWEELRGERLAAAIDGATVHPAEDEGKLLWEAQGARGIAKLEPSGWGTKVTLTAHVEDQVARLGVWARLRGTKPDPPAHADIERRLESLLDDLGAAHRRPFTRG